MALLCQRNSYLKSITSKILNCDLVKYKGKDLYKTILEETVFFPEGGGQPSDHGTINGVDVEFVENDKGSVLHYCTSPLPVGEKAECMIDWNRRFDHMQQHSAQHLISAIFETKYGLKTLSWELGSEVTNIELSTPNPLSAEMKDTVQQAANEYIRQALPVNVNCVTLAEAKQLAERVGCKDIPDDVIGPIRIIDIQGVDSNMCCGTHVDNLSKLQAIYLLHDTPIRGVIRLFFVAGNRVFSSLNRCLARETEMTSILGNGPEHHCEVVKNLKKTAKSQDTESKYMAKNLAELDAIQLQAKMALQRITCHHRECTNTLYVTRLLTVLNDWFKNNPDKMLLVTTGEAKGAGAFSAVGPTELLESIKETVLNTLEGKGTVVKGRFQGKAAKIENYKRLFTEIEKKTF